MMESGEVVKEKKIINAHVGDLMGWHQTQYIILNNVVSVNAKVTIEYEE